MILPVNYEPALAFIFVIEGRQIQEHYIMVSMSIMHFTNFIWAILINLSMERFVFFFKDF